jgi:branched-chain amino acid transport system ATP-binding protein
MKMLLKVENMHTFYGTSHILFGISLLVNKGEIVSLLGRNGVGKTTTLRSIMGLTPPRSGSIKFREIEIRGKPPFRIARMGIGYVPDDRRIFADLTVRQNLEAVARGGVIGGWTLERVYSLFPVLKRFENRKGGTLSGGEQQMLTIARTLMGNPELLLLDEPAEGLSPLVVKLLQEQTLRLKEEGITVLLCEQNVKFATEVSDRAYVLEKGMIRYEGTINDLKENEEVRKRYLMV